jgi:hypothetical protein
MPALVHCAQVVSGLTQLLRLHALPLAICCTQELLGELSAHQLPAMQSLSWLQVELHTPPLQLLLWQVKVLVTHAVPPPLQCPVVSVAGEFPVQPSTVVQSVQLAPQALSTLQGAHIVAVLQ